MGGKGGGTSWLDNMGEFGTKGLVFFSTGQMHGKRFREAGNGSEWEKKKENENCFGTESCIKMKRRGSVNIGESLQR